MVDNENSIVNPKPIFDQLGNMNSYVLVFKRLEPKGNKLTRKSTLKRLGVVKNFKAIQMVKNSSYMEEVDAN